MRRIMLAAAAAAILVLANVGLVAAADPVAIKITSASLVARGAAVDVTFAVVCAPSQDVTEYTVEYGSVSVDQAVTKKVMAHGSIDFYGQTLTCDGTTQNAMTARVGADTVPFAKGQAIVSVHLYLSEHTYWTSQVGDASVVYRLR